MISWIKISYQALATTKQIFSPRQYFLYAIHVVVTVLYFDVVAPPMSKGIFSPTLSSSLATKIISSRDGVISPDKPTISVREQDSHTVYVYCHITSNMHDFVQLMKCTQGRNIPDDSGDVEEAGSFNLKYAAL